MSKITKISIALTPEMADLLKAAVESGGYATSSEVVRDALRLWQRRQDVHRRELEEIGRLWDEGLASGPSRPMDMEATKREARRRFEAAKRKS